MHTENHTHRIEGTKVAQSDRERFTLTKKMPAKAMIWIGAFLVLASLFLAFLVQGSNYSRAYVHSADTRCLETKTPEGVAGSEIPIAEATYEILPFQLECVWMAAAGGTITVVHTDAVLTAAGIAGLISAPLGIALIVAGAAGRRKRRAESAFDGAQG
jgi:hypothetical protein